MNDKRKIMLELVSSFFNGLAVKVVESGTDLETEKDFSSSELRKEILDEIEKWSEEIMKRSEPSEDYRFG